jgi:hypothetical protein
MRRFVPVVLSEAPSGIWKKQLLIGAKSKDHEDDLNNEIV